MMIAYASGGSLQTHSSRGRSARVKSRGGRQTLLRQADGLGGGFCQGKRHSVAAAAARAAAADGVGGRVKRNSFVAGVQGLWRDPSGQDYMEAARERPRFLMQHSKLAQAPEALKLEFVDSWAGALVNKLTVWELEKLGQWKIDMVSKVAGEFDVGEAEAELDALVASAPVVVFSFNICPWCVKAKQVLVDAGVSAESIKVVEVDELGDDGVRLRATLATRTGRTSMPNVFIGGESIGGCTEGAPAGPGLMPLVESGDITTMLDSAGALASSAAAV